jgi:hypothetical protein
MVNPPRSKQKRTPKSIPLPYDSFRTGLTYHQVYHLLYGRKWKRRHGVLGYWHELKQRLYAEYLADMQPPEDGSLFPWEHKHHQF